MNYVNMFKNIIIINTQNTVEIMMYDEDKSVLLKQTICEYEYIDFFKTLLNTIRNSMKQKIDEINTIILNLEKRLSNVVDEKDKEFYKKLINKNENKKVIIENIISYIDTLDSLIAKYNFKGVNGE